MNAQLVPGVVRAPKGPTPAVGHMPFKGHRTVAEVWEDEARWAILRSLGK